MCDNNEIKKIRKKLLLKCFIYTTPLCLLALFFLVNIKYEFALSICFILTCLIILVPISIFNDKFSTLITKNYILPNLRKNFWKSISFDNENFKNYKPSIQPLNNSWGVYFNDWKNITNVISGSFNNVSYHIADANTQAHFLGRPFTSFYGQVIEINNNNLFQDEIFVLPKHIFNKNSYNGYLINKEFLINKHIVYTKNENIKNKEILFIKYFVEHFRKSKIYIQITKNKMLIMIDSNKSLLNRFNLIYTKEYDYSDINMIFNLIKLISEKC